MALLRLVCLIHLTLSFASASAQEPLRWEFNVGDLHHYQLTQSMDMQMSLGAAKRSVETEFQQIIDLTWKIESVDEQGRAKIVQTVDRLQMHLHAPGEQQMHFDTDSADSPAGFAAMLAPLVRALTSEAITFSLSPRGEVDDLALPASLAKSMEVIPGAAMMGDTFSKDGLRQMIQQSSLVLPETASLKPGHEWTRKSETSNELTGLMLIETTYRYDGPREIDGQQLEVFAANVQIGFGEVTNDIRIDVVGSHSEGEITFNRAKGYLESNSLQQNLTLNLSTGDSTTTQKLTQNTTFKRIEKSTEADR